jgi:hypothetical protein
MQVWGLYYEEQNRNFSGKVLYRSDIEVPRIITSKLTEKQLRLLKTTCLGDFLDVGRPLMFSQLIQHALVREIYQKNPNEMWFLFGKERVRFALSDFCLISGLSDKGSEDISSFASTENHLINKFFQGETVTRLVIKKIYQTAQFDDDEEAVRMSIIFLVCNFIMGTIEDNLVDTTFLNFLSYGELDTYPWGKAAFELTMKSLSQALKGHFKECDGGRVVYNLYKDRYCRSYKLNGLPYVFQVFMFETIPTLKEEGFCFEDKRSPVKLFNWKEIGKAPFYDKLHESVFATGKVCCLTLLLLFHYFCLYI